MLIYVVEKLSKSAIRKNERTVWTISLKRNAGGSNQKQLEAGASEEPVVNASRKRPTLFTRKPANTAD